MVKFNSLIVNDSWITVSDSLTVHRGFSLIVNTSMRDINIITNQHRIYIEIAMANDRELQKEENKEFTLISDCTHLHKRILNRSLFMSCYSVS